MGKSIMKPGKKDFLSDVHGKNGKIRSDGARYLGQATWQKVNQQGNVVQTVLVDEFDVPVPDHSNKRSNNFAILYLMKFYSLLEELGGKKWKVIQYIVEHMDYNNMLLMTYEEIAKKTGVSLITVKRTLSKLKDANFIAHKPGRIMLNPKLLNRKDLQGEMAIMYRFEELKAKPPEEDAPTNPPPA